MIREEEKEEGMEKPVNFQEEQPETQDFVTNGQAVFDIAMDPYNHMMRVLFGRWKPFILRAISIDDGTCFSQFFKQQIQRRFEFLIVLPHFRVLQNTHDHGEILLIFRRFLK